MFILLAICSGISIIVLVYEIFTKIKKLINKYKIHQNNKI